MRGEQPTNGIVPMKLLSFIESVNLMEAAVDRYLNDIKPIIQSIELIDPAKGEPISTWLKDEIKWAYRVFKKDDKIQWYTRFAKILALQQLVGLANAIAQIDPSKAELAQRIERQYTKVAGQLASKMGYDISDVADVAIRVTRKEFQARMEHFLSLGIPGIDDTRFLWQKPEDIFRAWSDIEREWQKNAKKLIDIDRDGVETVIAFPDGSEWVDLQQPYCRTEAGAMGHCGNTASYKDSHTVLSYRTIEKTKEGDAWKPRLTFVLDTETGLLGEMKGRANQKPDSKYHNVIMDLLLDPRIKGIGGGGLDAQNNFAMKDLPKDVMEQLFEKKPALASVEYDYNKRGMTADLLARIDALVDDAGEELPVYDKATKSFKIDMNSKDPNELLGEIGGNHGQWVASILSGDDRIEDYNSDDSQISQSYRIDILNRIDSKHRKALGTYLMKTYPDEITEWSEDNDTDFDASDADNIVLFVADFDIDSVAQALANAESSGHEKGAENEMSEAVQRYMADIPNNAELNLSVPWVWDAPLFMSMEEYSMIDVVSNQLSELEFHGNWVDFFQIKEMEGPYYGYDGYDEEAAAEDFLDRLSDEGVDINETVGSSGDEVNDEDGKPLPPPAHGDEEGSASWDWTDPYHSSGTTNAVLSNTP
jgi:hypothetical protein